MNGEDETERDSHGDGREAFAMCVRARVLCVCLELCVIHVGVDVFMCGLSGYVA
jgi:hypothetical protein